ncbi:MAG: ATP-binding cassette domain-containing protein [Roseobacter sp.]
MRRCTVGLHVNFKFHFFQLLTVSENLCIAMLAGRARMLDFFKPSALRWRNTKQSEQLATTNLPLLDAMDTPASDLPQGHRQFLEFAITAASESRVLLLDEPCAGLSPAETKLMTSIVRSYQDRTDGIIILIEHDMSILRDLADHVVVMHQGAVLAECGYDDIREDAAVKAVYERGTK